MMRGACCCRHPAKSAAAGTHGIAADVHVNQQDSSADVCVKGQGRGSGLTRRSARLGVSTSDGSGSLVIGLFLLRRSHLCRAAHIHGACPRRSVA